MRLFHAGDDAGDRDRAWTMQVAVVLDPRPGEDVGGGAPRERIILDAQAVRRAHAVVDHLITVFPRAIEHHGAAAAHAAHPWLQRAKRKGGGDHGVDAVAAGRQHLGADFRRPPRLRGDDAALRADRGLAELLRIGELISHEVSLLVSYCAAARRSGVKRTGSLRMACTKLFGATSIPPAYSMSGS